LILLVGHKTPQICFQALVDNFDLTIILGMIGCDEMQFSALEPQQFFPKFAGESWIMVEDNKVGNFMEFEDIVHENLSHTGCCEHVLEGTKMSIFGKLINYNHDDQFISRFG
jgi:hypothetical protein